MKSCFFAFVMILLLSLSSCDGLSIRTNNPHDTDTETGNSEGQLMKLFLWVPCDMTVEGGHKSRDYNLLRGGDFSALYREDEFLPEQTFIFSPVYDNYEEYVQVFDLFGSSNILFRVEHDGPIDVSLSNHPSLFNCEVKGMEITYGDWTVTHIHPVYNIGGANDLAFTVQTYSGNTYQYDRVTKYNPDPDYCFQIYLNDLLETPESKYDGVWRTMTEEIMNITATDFKTGAERASATIRIRWYSEWNTDLYPALDHSSPYYDDEDGKKHQLYDELAELEVDVPFSPYFEIEMIDYQQAVEIS